MSDNMFQQYDEFISALMEKKFVYMIQYDEEIAIVKDDEGEECIPFWSNEESIEKCIEEEWAEYKKVTVDAEDFTEFWLPQLLEDKITLLVNYDLETVVTATAEEVKKDLKGA